MDKQMQECVKPHSLIHTILGVGVGLVIANWLNTFSGQQGQVIGLFLILVAFLGEFYLAGAKKKR